MFQCRGIAQPLALYMLDKLAVPGSAYIATLFPEQDKFRDSVFYEGEADRRVFDQHFECVPAGAPLAVHGGFLIPVEKGGVQLFLLFPLFARHRRLMLAPFKDHVL